MKRNAIRYYIDNKHLNVYAVTDTDYYMWHQYDVAWGTPIKWSRWGTQNVFENPVYNYSRISLYQVRSLYPKIRKLVIPATNCSVTEQTIAQ